MNEVKIHSAIEHIPLNELCDGHLLFSSWLWSRFTCDSHNPPSILSEMKEELRAALRAPELRRTLES